MGKKIKHVTGSRPRSILSIGLGKPVVLACILFFYSLYSQEGFDTTPLISIRGNAQIYSSDSGFSRQFIAQGNKDYKISNSGKAVVFQSKDFVNGKKPARIKTNFSIQIIDRVGSGKLRKTVADFEHRKKSFNFCHLNRAPISKEQPYSSGSGSSYLIPSTTFNDFSKVCVFQYNLLTSLILELLYLEKYFYFNNRSLDFCFSEVFLVRPPPLLTV